MKNGIALVVGFITMVVLYIPMQIVAGVVAGVLVLWDEVHAA